MTVSLAWHEYANYLDATEAYIVGECFKHCYTTFEAKAMFANVKDVQYRILRAMLAYANIELLYSERQPYAAIITIKMRPHEMRK